jgi:translocation and assembly module TamB
MQLTFDASLPDVSPVAPGVSGPLAAKGVLRQTTEGIVLDTNATGPYASRASVLGLVTGPDANVDFNVNMPDIGALVAKVNGPLNVTGAARKQGAAWRLDTDAAGPAGTQAKLAGLVNLDGTLDLDITGNAPLGLARPFLAPRDLQGQAQFDVKVNGPAALSSVTGSVQATGATFSAPNLRVALQGIDADIQLANSRAQIDVAGAATNGGRVRLDGSIVLSNALSAELAIGIDDLILIDPNLYRTWINGDLTLSGPLAGGARISGQIDVGETEISVPSTGLTSIGDIPAITHIGATSAVNETRRKAGANGSTTDANAATDTGSVFGLNIKVNGPNRIFVRGRGLDAELGGALTVTGNTRRVISAGRFDLLRGRLDILGKRFELVDGAIQFQGDLVPYIRFVSTTTTSNSEVSVVVEGPANAPEVTFESTPEAPQDEVLAQFLFGHQLSEISPFQALQLANAVATLAGRGGIGVITNLRQGFGLDDLDVTTNDEGATAVRAGKYISENIYTDVTAASDGTGEVSLNLDISSHLKGKATLGSDGNSGIGIFYEKDY